MDKVKKKDVNEMNNDKYQRYKKIDIQNLLPLEFMYQERVDFIYSDAYYGIYMTDKDEWLMKVKNK